MRVMRRVLITLMTGLLALATVLLAPSASATVAGPVGGASAVAWDDVSGQGLQAWECESGNVCFWNGANGTGGRCMWDVADPDWQGGSIRCSWSATHNVKSVMNLGTSSLTGVVYYSGANYQTRKGCTRQQHGGNLAGTYKLRSHQWTSGSCG